MPVPARRANLLFHSLLYDHSLYEFPRKVSSWPMRYLKSSFLTFLASTAFITLGCRNVQNGKDYNLTDNGNLASIIISPNLNHVPVGTMQQFSAVAAFSDGHSEDFTKFVTWSS